MKVLIITNYLGNKGGLGRYSHEVAHELINQGWKVGVVSENSQPSTPYEWGILKPVFRQSKIKQIINIIYNAVRVRWTGREYEIVHAHDGWPYALYGYIATLWTGKKLFITGIGTYSVAPLVERGFKKYIIRWSYKKADHIFCISDYVKKLITDVVPHVKISTVLMGTTLLPVIPQQEKEKYVREQDLLGRYPLILTVGDIKNRKGQLDTLRGLQLLKNKYPQFLYVIIGVGDPPYLAMIKEFVEKHHLEKNVRIVSNMYDDRMLAFYYQTCDIFALNSNNSKNHFEGFGLVMLEAAQFGKPVIGSRGCGIESALRDGYNGYLTYQGNAQDIADKVEKILADTEQHLSKNSLIFFKDFSWKKTVADYIKEYIN